MTRPPDFEDILDYFRQDAREGGLPTDDFKQVLSLSLPLLEKLRRAATDQALANLAMNLNDEQRAWIQRLATAANRIDEAGMVDAIGKERYRVQKEPRFGVSNPELMDMAFWKLMVQRSWTAWSARVHFDRACQEYMRALAESPMPSVREIKELSGEELITRYPATPTYQHGGPVWSFSRFGMSHTRLPDGREIWIAGEHEDSYDPDFYIYNDVIVVHPDLSVDIYGYPQTVFSPTDFHTATLVDGNIYIIGCLGYHGARQPEETPVYRLNCQEFRIEKVATRGDNPGWIYGHQAVFDAAENAIKITEGKIITGGDGEQKTEQNVDLYRLDLATGEWSRGGKPRHQSDTE